MNKKIGWREWLSLPELGIPAIKAKVDTGARTSALHAYFVEPFEEEGIRMVRFGIHPIQKKTDFEIVCTAKIKDERPVTDSGGHREMRFVIESEVEFMGERWPVELTLTNRDTMKFRMLLGRTALRGRFDVDAGASFIGGRKLQHAYKQREL
ncbi:MAG: ATP-dependent zinc protease [Desulfuromonas sp.]|nr:MAG: ATP-dependent zinc protease [Desulfuromonas sp.]